MPFNQNGARLSPDGKSLAYVSDESGQFEVYVQALSDSSVRAQVSSEGGINPGWANSSNELLFQSKNRVMSVKFSPGVGSILANRFYGFRTPKVGRVTTWPRMDV